MSEDIIWYYNELTELLDESQKLLNEMKAVQNPPNKLLKWIVKLEETVKSQEARKQELKEKYGL
jgi:hypothetical protein